MSTPKLDLPDAPEAVAPLCIYFGRCGGCRYQDLSYEAELKAKEERFRKLFWEKLGNHLNGAGEEIFQSIVPSPEPYFYRSRLDLSLRRRGPGARFGFQAEGSRRFIPIESCSIARPEINAFLPQLMKEAAERLPADYRGANLVIKTDDEGKVRWGGIGRRSLELPEAEYFFTEIEGKRIFYSLDTFFQANLGILPSVIQNLRELLALTSETHLLDLYAGVGLFWAVLARETGWVWAVEESPAATPIAEFNRRTHDLAHVSILEGKTEDRLEQILEETQGVPKAAILDPPRKGLSPEALERLKTAKALQRLIYLSCHPDSLIRDLAGFLEAGWRIDFVRPFDFFPRTQHLEVMVRLLPD